LNLIKRKGFFQRYCDIKVITWTKTQFEGEFKRLLEEHLVPLLSGSEIRDAPRSKQSHSLVSFETVVSLFLKPSKSSSYRLRLFRRQQFDKNEKRLVRTFIQQIGAIRDGMDKPYFSDLMVTLPRRVIAEFLAASGGKTVLLESTQQFESLASRTYEGHQIASALGITGSRGHGVVRLSELWKEDFSMVLANGIDTMYVAGRDGRIFNLEALPAGENATYAPHRFSAIANWCDSPNRVALALNRNGEILLFKEKRLQFAKRRGSWTFYAHEPVLSQFGRGLRRDLKNAIYETCLDVSFARTGGCIAVLTSKNASKLSEYINMDDVIGETRTTKTKLLSKAIRASGRFHLIDRRLRLELLSMDGATILDHKGNILAAGAIVKVPSGSTGGGRKAAAQQLSKLGLGIKISSDGPVSGYRKRKAIFTL
jgi:hypothetical protein